MSRAGRTLLDRRTLLRGAIGGVAMSMGLPTLELFLDANGDAYADGSSFPKRFGVFFWGNGTLPGLWTPTTQGASWELSEQLGPLAAVKDQISVVTGMALKSPNSTPHESGASGIMAGGDLIQNTFSLTRPSVDQSVADEIGRDTRFRSLELGVVDEGNFWSFADANVPNPIEFDPHTLYRRLFVDGFTPPGAEPVVDPLLVHRLSVLDAVREQSGRLCGKLGAVDRQRLEQHLDGVRDLERQLANVTPTPLGCVVPGQPATDYPALPDGSPDLSARNAVMAGLLASALSCDQTRVFTYWLTGSQAEVRLPGVECTDPASGAVGPCPETFHRYTHDERGVDWSDQPIVNQCVKRVMVELNEFLSTLSGTPEGDGSLLDNCGILCTSDCSWGAYHLVDEYPIIVAGRAGGTLNAGVHYRSPSAENVNSVTLSLARAMGLNWSSWGEGAAKTSDGLSAIENW